MSGNKKLKIVFLNHWAKNLGGAEHSLIDILTYASNVFSSYLITTEHGQLHDRVASLPLTQNIIPCKDLSKINRQNLLKSILTSIPQLFSFIRYVYVLKDTIQRINPHAIHANVPKSHITLFLLRMLGYKEPCFYHMREIFNKYSLPWFFYAFMFTKKNTYVICISRAVKNNLPRMKFYNSTVIYNGVFIDPSPKKTLELNTIKLLYLGRIVPWKKCQILINIFYRIKKIYPDKSITLSLVGDTLYWKRDYRDYLSKIINDKQLTSSCNILPYSTDPVSVYRSHTIFCNASCNEPFGRVIAEAQACGMPVVAFNTGGVSEIIRHNKTGILVPDMSIDMFCKALCTLIEHSDLIHSMGIEGRKRATHFFNREIQTPAIISHINKTVLL